MPRDADFSKSRPKSGKSASQNTRASTGQRQGQRPGQRQGQRQGHQAPSSLPEIASKARSGHLLYGYHAVMAALENPQRKAFHLFLSPQAVNQLDEAGQIGASISANLPRTILDRRQLDQMLSRTSSANTPQADAAVHQHSTGQA